MFMRIHGAEWRPFLPTCFCCMGARANKVPCPSKSPPNHAFPDFSKPQTYGQDILLGSVDMPDEHNDFGMATEQCIEVREEATWNPLENFPDIIDGHPCTLQSIKSLLSVPDIEVEHCRETNDNVNEEVATGKNDSDLIWSCDTTEVSPANAKSVPAGYVKDEELTPKRSNEERASVAGTVNRECQNSPQMHIDVEDVNNLLFLAKLAKERNDSNNSAAEELCEKTASCGMTDHSMDVMEKLDYLVNNSNEDGLKKIARLLKRVRKSSLRGRMTKKRLQKLKASLNSTEKAELYNLLLNIDWTPSETYNFSDLKVFVLASLPSNKGLLRELSEHISCAAKGSFRAPKRSQHCNVSTVMKQIQHFKREEPDAFQFFLDHEFHRYVKKHQEFLKYTESVSNDKEDNKVMMGMSRHKKARSKVSSNSPISSVLKRSKYSRRKPSSE